MAKYYDTLLGEYIKNPWVRGLSLDKLAHKDFNYSMISYDEITHKGKINFREVYLDEAAIYSGEDVYMTHKLYEKQVWEGVTDNSVLQNIDIPFIHILKQMEMDGVCIDRDRLKEIGTLLGNEILRLEKDIFHDAGVEFNIKSPKQVWEILFDTLGLPRGKKTKTGYSVSADVLWELAHAFPIAQKIVDYRHYSKLDSTYIDGLLELVDDNELIHTSYNSAVTATGRLSSTNPNLQNIPSSHGIAWEIRDGFISRFEKGNIMAFDYSQIELRLLAIMSQDENLLEIYKNDWDIHHKTSQFLFPDMTITWDHRKIAKAVNFWVIYGLSGFWLSKMIGISMKDAKIYIDAFFNNYPKVRVFLDQTIEDAKKNGYVETLFWRKRFLPNINDKNAIIANSAKREAINMPIQGTNADIMKIAMIEVQDFLKTESLKSKMIMQVHDEIVFDVFPGEEDILAWNITRIMQDALSDTLIPLKVEYGLSNTWKNAK